MIRTLGIDIGNSGAIAILDNVSQIVLLVDMPVYKIKKNSAAKRPDIDGLIKFFDDNNIANSTDDVIFIEKPQKIPPMFGSNVQANFMGGYYEALFTVLFKTRGCKYQFVQPKAWQSYFGISKDTKIMSYDVASRLFPTAELKTVRGKLLDGRCDALLIAEYGRKNFYK